MIYLFRVVALSSALADNGYWGAADAQLTEAYLLDLLDVDYKVPSYLTNMKGKGIDTYT